MPWERDRETWTNTHAYTYIYNQHTHKYIPSLQPPFDLLGEVCRYQAGAGMLRSLLHTWRENVFKWLCKFAVFWPSWISFLLPIFTPCLLHIIHSFSTPIRRLKVLQILLECQTDTICLQHNLHKLQRTFQWFCGTSRALNKEISWRI